MPNPTTLQGFIVELLTFADFGVLYEDEHGVIQYSNPKLHELLHIPVPPEAILGKVCLELAGESAAFWEEPQLFLQRIAELYASNETVRNEMVRSAGGSTYLRDLIPVRFDHVDRGRLWLYRDVTAQAKSEDDLKASRHQLQGITDTLLHYINSADSRKSLPILLEYILELTGSKYGFIGEVLYDEHGNPYLKSHAITDIAWNDQTREYYKAYVDEGIEFRNLKTLFGQTLVHQDVFIANDPSTNPHRGGLPPGHPPMHAYIGIPFFKNDQMMGMIGLANKPGGYTSEVVDAVKPFLVTASTIIENFRQELDRKRIQKEVTEREQRWQLAIEGTLEGIWDLDFSTMKIFFSDYCKSLFSANVQEFGGFGTILKLVDPKDKISILRLYDYLKNGRIQEYILNGELRIPMDPDEPKWLQWRCAILRDENNQVIRLTGSLIDVTKKKKVEEEIKIALHKQENLNQLRQRFVTMASHEFKSPLTSIQTSSDLIEMVLDKEDAAVVPKILKYTNRIRQQVRRLNNILSDILILGRLEANQLQLKLEWVSITTLITDVKEHLSHLIDDDRELILESHVSCDRILVDINLMMHLLSNLISNAYKYSEGRPSPIIRFTLHHGLMQIQVEDFGIGMNEQDLNNMFQPFYRSDSVAAVKGYGLGLVLVKEIIDVHHGTVDVKSELGKGTTVCVRIPQPKSL